MIKRDLLADRQVGRSSLHRDHGLHVAALDQFHLHRPGQPAEVLQRLGAAVVGVERVVERRGAPGGGHAEHEEFVGQELPRVEDLGAAFLVDQARDAALSQLHPVEAVLQRLCPRSRHRRGRRSGAAAAFDK